MPDVIRKLIARVKVTTMSNVLLGKVRNFFPQATEFILYRCCYVYLLPSARLTVGYISQKASDNLTRSASFRKLALYYYLRACSTSAKIAGNRKVLSPVCHGVGYVEG